MGLFRIAKIEGKAPNRELEVFVCNGSEGSRSDFSVCLSHDAGGLSFQMGLTPDQSRRLRAALEDAEAKAEILTAAI